MKRTVVRSGVVLIICGLFAGGAASGETKDLGSGFRDHGKGAPENENSFNLDTVVTGPNGTICGTKPSRPTSFVYYPKTGEWKHQQNGPSGHLALDKKDTCLYAARNGRLEEWDPSKPEVEENRHEEEPNPHTLAENDRLLGGEVCGLLALPDGRTIVMGGKPDFREKGSGLLFWDSEAKIPTVVRFNDLLPNQWTVSFAALPEGKLVGGTSIDRYENKATEPELYIMDVATKTVEWHKALFSGLTEYTSLCTAQNGIVYGIARLDFKESKSTLIERRDPKRFFAFDPFSQTVVYQNDWDMVEGSAQSRESRVSYGGPIAFIPGKGSDIFVLFRYWIAKVDHITHALSLVAHSPVEIELGGGFLDGRIYFGGRTNLYSYEVSSTAAK